MTKSKKLNSKPFRRTIRKRTKKVGGMPISDVNLTDRLRHPSKEKIVEFIRNKLSVTGPNIINLPMPADENDSNPEFHAILVDLSGDEILVSDWEGDRREPAERSNYYYSWPKWKTYKLFIESLEETLNKRVIFAKVDDDLKEEAQCKHNRHRDQGGCSEYIYSWAKRHYPDYFRRRGRIESASTKARSPTDSV